MTEEKLESWLHYDQKIIKLNNFALSIIYLFKKHYVC